MRITELLKKESIELGVKVADKNAAIDKLISLMDAGGRLNSIQAVSYTHLDVYKRQSQVQKSSCKQACIGFMTF